MWLVPLRLPLAHGFVARMSRRFFIALLFVLIALVQATSATVAGAHMGSERGSPFCDHTLAPSDAPGRGAYEQTAPAQRETPQRPDCHVCSVCQIGAGAGPLAIAIFAPRPSFPRNVNAQRPTVARSHDGLRLNRSASPRAPPAFPV